MDLFHPIVDEHTNLLPKDGTVYYYGKIINQSTTDFYFNRLIESIEWKHDEAIIFGQLITTKRKVAWYGDTNFKYSYSKITKEALLWTEELLVLKQLVEEKTGETYNSCLLNLYHDGSEGMTWHSDDEKDLKKNAAIASLSLGVGRKFAFKHKFTKETINLILESGSLLVMKDEIQTYWLHRLPPSKKINKPRINLTFRYILPQ